MLGLAAVLGPVDTMTTVETGVVTGHLVFPTATTSPFSTSTVGAVVITTLLARLSATILG
jgi:hypothetical protein